MPETPGEAMAQGFSVMADGLKEAFHLGKKAARKLNEIRKGDNDHQKEAKAKHQAKGQTKGSQKPKKASRNKKPSP